MENTAKLDMRVHIFSFRKTGAKAIGRCASQTWKATCVPDMTVLPELTLTSNIGTSSLSAKDRKESTLPLPSPFFPAVREEAVTWPNVRLASQRSLLVGGQVLSLSEAGLSKQN